EPFCSLLDAGAVLRTFDRAILESALQLRGRTLTDAEYEQFLHYSFCPPYVEMDQASALHLHELIRRTCLEMLHQHAPDTFLELEGCWTEAITALEQGVILLRQLGDRLPVSVILNGIGNIYYEQGELNEALKRYDKAYDLLDQAQNNVSIATLLNNIGNVYY